MNPQVYERAYARAIQHFELVIEGRRPRLPAHVAEPSHVDKGVQRYKRPKADAAPVHLLLEMMRKGPVTTTQLRALVSHPKRAGHLIRSLKRRGAVIERVQVGAHEFTYSLTSEPKTMP